MLIVKSRKIKGGMILVILASTIIGIPMGITKIPSTLISLPSGFGGFGGQLLKIDILGALRLSYLPFIIALFIPDFFSTFGTLFGVSAQAGYLDKEGNIPGVDKCFEVDAVASVAGSLFCMPSVTTYLESSAGVEAGGRTGLTVVFTSLLFALMLFFTPVALMIPSAATAPVLIYIGVNMLSGMKNINFNDITEYIPAFLCVTFTIFANNIANGICIAIPAYLILKLASGKIKEVSISMYVVTIICLLYFYTIITI
jgi:AGZA family xanthine/uracil permease-like MFS transporter